MTRICGHFVAWKDDQGEYLKLGFSLPSIPMQHRPDIIRGGHHLEINTAYEYDCAV